MDPTCGLVDKFRDLALNLIGEQILYLIYYHKNIEQLNRLLVELTLERSSIQRRIDEAANNVEQIEEKVLHWLSEVDEILKQIHEFNEEESQAKTECSITSCPNPWLRYKLSKRAKAMAQEVAEINGKRNFDRISYRVPPPSMPNLTKRESNEGIDSRVPIMNQIMEALRNPSVNMIGLCGPGGVGKTTIAKEVAKNQKMFEKVIMATVSQELNVEKIQGQIAEKLGMQLNENNKDVRASRLRERLKKEKNMLLILDDLWDELDLGEVGISFVDVENDSKKNEENDSEKNEGCKILLISRNKMLLSGRMKCQRIVEVGVLSEDEALELFKKIAELSVDSSSPELISIATEIVRKCGGLPIAIATAAKTLRNNKDINEWEDARKRLNNPFRRNNTLTREVDSVLKWSYDRLSSPEYKHIFLLAAMLSHDPSIDDLLMYSVGLDILDGIENMEDARIRISATKLLSSLKKLEVLYMGNSFDRWKVEGSSEADENASLEELKDLPISSLDIQIPDVSMLSENLFLKMKLKRYRIFIGKRWEWLGNYETSKILRLELQSSIDLTARLRKLLEGVEDLHLYGSKGLENVLYSHDARGFSCLRHLQIESNDDIKYIVLNSAHHEDAFPILESLKLKNLKSLEKLYEGSNAIVFRQLHTLKMKNLPALTADPCIRDRGTNHASNKIFKSLFNKKVLFPNLDILKLSNLKHLIPLIWDDQLSHNSFSNLKTLSVKSCGFVKLVPLHVLKCLNKLEELEVSKCDMLEKVFDFEDLNDYNKMESSSVVVPLKRLKLWNLPKLKDVWSDHYQGNVSFQSLRSIDVSDCERLTNMFPASIAKGMLRDLEELRIDGCGIDVIVAKDQIFESVAAAFEFPRLISLQLSYLPNLRNFYPQRHTLEWPQLQQLSIEYCDVLELFEKEVSSSSEIHEEENTLASKYPLLPHDKVIGKLEELKLPGKQVEVIGSGQFPMYHFPEVKVLYVYAEESTTILYSSLWKSFPKLEELLLSGDFEEVFRGDDVAVPFSKLTLMNISNMISLSPSFVSSPNLTHLQVTSSYKWTTLMTSSTARNLVHLTCLSISSCYQIEEIITMHEGEDDENNEIVFNKLEFLELEYLSSLKRFCRHNYTFKFPLLGQLIIKECPKFNRFSPGLIDTPSLKSVQLSQDWESHHEIWDTNLNKTFYQQRFVAARELVLDEDEAIMIRNDQFLVKVCPEVEILRIERFVDEWVIFPYTLLERFPKLNELHVEDCSFEEIFPSHAHIVDQIPPLKELYLANLTVLKVSKCHQLICLVTNSTTKSLVNLETLEIDDCEKLEEIVTIEANEDVERGIIFNGLRIIKLSNLPRLKAEEDKRDFNIEDRATNTRCRNIFRSLFSYNKVLLPKLEILELSNLLNNLISLIWDDQLLHNSFSNLKTLIVQSCGFLKVVPLHVLKSLNNLEKLEVSYCDKLEMVFGFEDLNDYDNEMESSQVVVPLNLTHLEVTGCCGLTTLMTSSAAPSLIHITHISISNCNQIGEILMKQEGEYEEDKEIFFNKMKYLKLDDLPRLKSFCGHNYTFRFPLLEHVIITECPQLAMFCPGDIYAPQLQSVRVDRYEPHEDIWMTNLNNTIKHLFTFEEVIFTAQSMALNAKNITTITDVFREVTTLYVESFPDEGTTFPYSSLERFPKLYKLFVEHCSFEEIFPSHGQIIDFMGKIPRFRELHIAYLDQLKSIWKDDSQLPSIHQNLRELEVKSCCKLVKLAPSSASFQNLWKLSISGCHQLIHLVTSSTAKSLVSLEELEINDCKKMEKIVMKETNEDVEGAITFNQLQRIKLTDMPSLKMFSSQNHTFKFPELEEIQITGFPQIKAFCPGVLETPKLSKVKIEGQDMEWKDKDQDLNKTIEMLSSAKDSVNT